MRLELRSQFDTITALPTTALRHVTIEAVAQAVQHAHQRGILHRDLKPSNIMVDGEGKPYVTDFGLARLLRKDSDLTLSGAAIGTPNYMAPEQAQGKHKELTTATDVFSLGAILYELLTGKGPFNAETPLETVKQVVEADPTPPSRLNSRVDRDLETICLKCLEKLPARRYQSARDLADDLQRWQNHEPISARPATASERFRKWLRRHPVRATLGGFIILSLVGFGITMALNQVRLQAERDFAQGRLADSLLREGEAHAANNRLAEAKLKVLESRNLSGKRKSSTLPADLALLDIYRFSPPPLLTLRGHQGKVTCIAVSADERIVFSGGQDGTIRQWSLPIGREEAVSNAHSAGVTALARSPSGMVLVSGSADGELKAWDLNRPGQWARLTGHSNKVSSIVFTVDGETFASASVDGWIHLWRSATLKHTEAIQTTQKDICGLAFTTNGLQLMVASADGSGIVMWNLNDHKQGYGFPSAGNCKCLATSSGGEVVFSSDSSGVVSRREQLGKSMPKPDIRLRSPAASMAVSIKKERLATGSADGTIALWDYRMDQSAPEVVLSEHEGAVTGIAFLGQDRFIVSSGGDGTVRVWNTLPQQGLLGFKQQRASFHSMAFSRDGLTCLTSDEGGYGMLWDAATGKRLQILIGHRGSVFDAAFAPDGRTAASAGADGTVRVWAVATGKELGKFASQPAHSPAKPSRFRCVVFWPDGKAVLAGEELQSGEAVRSSLVDQPQARLFVLDAKTGAEMTNLVAHRGGVRAIAVSADGGTVMTAGGDGRLKVWDPETWRERMSISAYQTGASALVLMRDGRHCVAAGASRPPVVWQVGNGRELSAMSGLPGQVVSLALSADESLLLAGTGRGELKLWDLLIGKEIHTFQGGSGPRAVRAVSFSPRGRETAAAMGNLNLWDFDRVSQFQALGKTADSARRALQNEPTNGAALKALADWYAFHGAWNWAVELLERAQQNGTDVSHLMIARCHWQQDQLTVAAAEMRRASSGHEAADYYLAMCQAAIAQEIEDQLTNDTALVVPAGAMVVPAISGSGKDIWTSSQIASSPLSETPGGGVPDEKLQVGGWGDEYQSLLQFDLTRLPPKADSALLCLYCRETLGYSNSMHVERITADWDWRKGGTGWDRDTLWWKDRPEAVRWSSEPLAAPRPGRWYAIDITGLYNAWQAGVFPNYGLRLIPTFTANETFNRFYSSRYKSKPDLSPQLVIVPGKD